MEYKKKTIGILCYWGVPNYGAWVQAYAMNKVVRNIVGEDCLVQHLNYLHPTHFNSYYKNDKLLHLIFSYSYNLIPSTEKITAEQLEKMKFDIIITGADDLWDFTIKNYGEDFHLIGDGLNCNKLISYAPSCGTMESNSSMLERMTGINAYDYLSVRDINSANVVMKLTGKKPQITLDPCLLWDFKADSAIRYPDLDNYILVYGCNWDEDYIYHAKKFATEKRLLLVSVGYINKWCDMNIKFVALRGTEWVGMFEKASYIFTSMFHGLMLSLSFEKQVKFNRVGYVKNRSEYLLKELGLSLYLNEQKNYEDIFKSTIDYTTVTTKLNTLRKSSLEYLREALSE